MFDAERGVPSKRFRNLRAEVEDYYRFNRHTSELGLRMFYVLLH